MEAEELDRIFRAKLDELEQVPDLVWDDTTTWTKVSPKVKTGWSQFWTWGVMGVVMLLSVLVWLKPDKTPASKIKKVIVETAELPSKKLDTLLRLAPKRLLSVSAFPKEITVPSQNTLRNVHDRVSTPERSQPFIQRPKAKEYWLIEPRLRLKRSDRELHLDPWDLTMDSKDVIGLYMPQTPVLRLQIGNTLNLSHALKLFETVQDQGASFRYSYIYRPSPFANSIAPFQKQDPRVIYINDYDK